jgi:diguanylate cyclase (GGDEF)-like protein
MLLDLDHFKLVRAAVEKLVIPDLKKWALSVTVSVGMDCAADGAVSTPDQLYHRADTALYAVKAAGRNRIVLASDYSPQHTRSSTLDRTY